MPIASADEVIDVRSSWQHSPELHFGAYRGGRSTRAFMQGEGSLDEAYRWRGKELRSFIVHASMLMQKVLQGSCSS
jgi:hypothetical protein